MVAGSLLEEILVRAVGVPVHQDHTRTGVGALIVHIVLHSSNQVLLRKWLVNKLVSQLASVVTQLLC